MKKSAKILTILLCIMIIFTSGCTAKETKTANMKPATWMQETTAKEEPAASTQETTEKAEPTAVATKPTTVALEPSRTWAVIMDMKNLPSEKYEDSKRMKKSLIKLGCSEKHIKLVQEELTKEVVQAGVEWLAQNSKEGDTIIVYISAHGSRIESKIGWNNWFPQKWRSMNDRTRLLFVDSCQSGKFIANIDEGVKPTISISAVSADEIGWAGSKEEGLPIIGSVWTYYFIQAMTDKTADTNKDGYVSIEEAYRLASDMQQKYIKEKVITVPAFLEMYHNLGAYPDEVDKYPNSVLKENMDGELLLYKIK